MLQSKIIGTVISATMMAASVAHASNTVTGTVRLTDGTAVEGATVSLRFDGSVSPTTTDGSGSYTLSDIDSGFAIVDAVFVSGGQTFTGSAWVGFAPGGGSTATADITVRPSLPFGPFPPLGG